MAQPRTCVAGALVPRIVGKQHFDSACVELLDDLLDPWDPAWQARQHVVLVARVCADVLREESKAWSKGEPQSESRGYTRGPRAGYRALYGGSWGEGYRVRVPEQHGVDAAVALVEVVQVDIDRPAFPAAALQRVVEE